MSSEGVNRRRPEHIVSSREIQSATFRVKEVEKTAKKADGIAMFAFKVLFRAQEKPEEFDKAHTEGKYQNLNIHAHTLDEALQILQVMGHKFKQMKRGEIEHHLKNDFYEMRVVRKHSNAKGTTFDVARQNVVTGEGRYEEMQLSSRELQDLHHYANALRESEALKDVIEDPQAEINLERANPSAALDLNRQVDPATAPGVQFTMNDQLARTSKEGYIGNILSGVKDGFQTPESFSDLSTFFPIHIFLKFFGDEIQKQSNPEKSFEDALEECVTEAKNQENYESEEIKKAFDKWKAEKNDSNLKAVLTNLLPYSEIYATINDEGFRKVKPYQIAELKSKLDEWLEDFDEKKGSILEALEPYFPGLKNDLSPEDGQQNYTKEQLKGSIVKWVKKEFEDIIEMSESEYSDVLLPKSIQKVNESSGLFELLNDPSKIKNENLEEFIRSLVSCGLTSARDGSQNGIDKLKDLKKGYIVKATVDVNLEGIQTILREENLMSKFSNNTRANKSHLNAFLKAMPSCRHMKSAGDRFADYKEWKFADRDILKHEQLYLNDALKFLVAEGLKNEESYQKLMLSESLEDYFLYWMHLVTTESIETETSGYWPFSNTKDVHDFHPVNENYPMRPELL